MTPEEFSNGMDVILNSYSVSPGYGHTETPITIQLDEYEKSWFLTKAQEQLVLEWYSGRNASQSSFESTEELRSKLRNLISTKELQQILEDQNYTKLSSLSKLFEAGSDVLFITYEQAALDDQDAGCLNGNEISVVPITQDEYNRIKNNPFRRANKHRALRLDHHSDNNHLVLEIISKYNIKNYIIRYIRKPRPIIVSTLDPEVTINREHLVSPCELDSSLHNLILERAATLAIASKGKQQTQ